ncbi:hypothetical protein GCM10009868_07800 [Terrabacter aerolatus]|uniref:Uncharacterized protein n=1 Tax=Terrabacter aerolatus TaxID=422442 RepID=A0A512D4W1_9MICO|nr:hypothetical protein TAE01_33250 [Terrabacter aerolatus]
MDRVTIRWGVEPGVTCAEGWGDIEDEGGTQIADWLDTGLRPRGRALAPVARLRVGATAVTSGENLDTASGTCGVATSGR